MTGTRVLLVASAAPDEGGGHLARALAVAQALVELGAEVSLQLRRGSTTAAQRAVLASQGVSITTGDARAPDAHDVVVVDVPDPGEVARRFDASRLVAFDDGDRLRDPAAVVVQPSLPAWRGSARVGRVLAGYEWAPIRVGLLSLSHGPVGATPAGLLICFGASDPADVAARVVPEVANAVHEARLTRDGVVPGSAIATTVIVGAGYRGRLESGAAWDVLRDPSDIDARLAAPRLALIGGGTMKFELAVLGVPTLTLAVADDQLAGGPGFAATGASRFLGDGRTLEPRRVVEAVVALLADERALKAMRSAARAAVDGHGARRLAEVILEVGRASPSCPES